MKPYINVSLLSFTMPPALQSQLGNMVVNRVLAKKMFVA